MLSAAYPSMALAQEASKHVRNRVAASSIVELLRTSRALSLCPSSEHTNDDDDDDAGGEGGENTGGYEVYRDPGSGHLYYVDPTTGESTWDCPVGLPVQGFTAETVRCVCVVGTTTTILLLLLLLLPTTTLTICYLFTPTPSPR